MNGATKLVAIMGLALSLLPACVGEPATTPRNAAPSGGTRDERTASTVAQDERTVAIYEAVIRDQVEWRGDPVWIFDRLCRGAGDARRGGRCPESLSQSQKRALSAALADLGPIRFVSVTDPVVDQIFAGKRGFLVRLGPIDGRGDRVQVAASHYCGGLCGGGSTWVVQRADAAWKVSGPAPGSAVWIS